MADSCTKTCVAYLWDQTRELEKNFVFTSAQQHAIKQKLPLIVVTVVRSVGSQNISRLKIYEQYLSGYQIPLMVLIGDERERIAGFIRHTNPVAIFSDDQAIELMQKFPRGQGQLVYRGKSEDKLQLHPYKWPGRVMNIAELTDIY